MRIPGKISSSGAHIQVPTLELGQCLAKTCQSPGGIRAGRTVEEHCRIAGAVAAALLQRLEAVSHPVLPARAHMAALTHDVGKVCPTFQAKIYDAACGREQRAAMPALQGVNPAAEQAWRGHASVSYASILARSGSEALAQIVGEHHGRPPEKNAPERPGYGGQAWERLRQELLQRLLGDAPDWPVLKNQALQRAVSGLTITADWLASGDLFDDPAADWHPLIGEALDRAGFCWPVIRTGLSFAALFGFEPRPAQKSFYESVSGPGVYVLEAPMGLGKTEAALYAAYRMLEARRNCGIYFALPTRLTSNRIYHRVNSFLGKIFEKSSSAHLVHGMAWLERYQRQELGAEGAPEQSWFAQGKRGILAPFAVGTIDQALLSAMHVRHGSLRTFGLCGKVVILDEVHSYDAYTGSILDALVAQLRQAGCTVIILSATLTQERRAAITGASSTALEYPLISALPVQGEPRTLACAGPPDRRVHLLHADEAAAVEEALLRAEQGQRVLWVENTVVEAQQRYTLLASRAAAMQDLPVGLLHSRFTPADRTVKEEYWTGFFSPQAADRGRQGCILVGTQVVEQSLDMDADFLVSRFCPTDMLLQRMGRLWRHGQRTARPEAARCEALLLHPSLEKAQNMPDRAFGLSGAVYAPYVLCRSLELWHERDAVVLPQEIRQLLEATYAAREESIAAMAAAYRLLQEQSKALHSRALRSMSSTGQAVEDDDPPTRLNERPEINLLVVRRWQRATGHLELADGTELDLQCSGANWTRKAKVAASLALNMVRVPVSRKKWHEQRLPGDQPPEFLKKWIYCDNVRTGLLADSGELLSLDGCALVETAQYDAELGYAVLYERS